MGGLEERRSCFPFSVCFFFSFPFFIGTQEHTCASLEWMLTDYIRFPRFSPHTVIDLSYFGGDLKDSEQNKLLRSKFMSEPLFASFLDDLPEAKDFIMSPETIVEQAKETYGSVIDELEEI